MRFDFVISNPPFNAGPDKGNLHLKIMEECIMHADRCIVLAPIWWFGLTDEAKRNKDRYTWTIGVCTKRIEYLSAESSEKWFRGECKNSSLGIYDIGGTNVGFFGFLLLNKFDPNGVFNIPKCVNHGEFVECKLNKNE